MKLPGIYPNFHLLESGVILQSAFAYTNSFILDTKNKGTCF